MSSGLQVVTEFVTEVRRFVLINSDYKEVVTRWAGVSIRVPGNEETVAADPQNPTAFASATDTDGSYIPGTLVIQDRYGPDGEGGEVLAFDAGYAVRYILGVHTRTGLANSQFARRGLSLLPRSSKRADLERIRKAGHARSEAWRIDQARTLVQDIDTANAKREAKKIPPIPGGEAYVHAVMELRNYHAREQRILAEITSGEDVKAVEPLAEAEIDGDRLLADYLKKAVSAATEGVSMSEEAKELMVEKVINDPVAMAIIARKYKMAKRLVPVPKRKKATQALTEKPIPAPPAVQATDLEGGEEEEGHGIEEIPEGLGDVEEEAPSVGMSGDLPDHIKEQFNDPEPEEPIS